MTPPPGAQRRPLGPSRALTSLLLLLAAAAAAAPSASAAAAAAAAASADAAPVAASAAPRPSLTVVGYLPEWRYGGANFDVILRHLSHLVFFSVEPAHDGSGKITGLDRLPNAEVLADARAAAVRHGTKLLMCLGGNGRSSGFAPAVLRKASRARLAQSVADLVQQLQLDGVDYNWEYPAFSFGKGYADAATVKAEFDGLAGLVTATRKAFAKLEEVGGGPRKVITMAYYPDGRQEAELKSRGLDEACDLLHAMTYDAPGANHSPVSLAETAVANAKAAGLRLSSITLGLPFYGRHSATGDWTTYEDIVQRYKSARAGGDSVSVAAKDGGGSIGFNGPPTIEGKVRLAVKEGLGGVMVWESGQDCRAEPVTRGGQTHVRTCPDGQGAQKADPEALSLHAAVTRALTEAGAVRAFSPEAPQAPRKTAKGARAKASNEIEL